MSNQATANFKYENFKRAILNPKDLKYLCNNSNILKHILVNYRLTYSNQDKPFLVYTEKGLYIVGCVPNEDNKIGVHIHYKDDKDYISSESLYSPIIRSIDNKDFESIQICAEHSILIIGKFLLNKRE